jgi:hypothetical protein
MAVNCSETHPRSLYPTVGRTATAESEVNPGNKVIFLMPVKMHQAEGLPCNKQTNFSMSKDAKSPNACQVFQFPI